jgi:tartrate dehydratase alpha subunit/fumarate hydratase class I-like protein
VGLLSEITEVKTYNIFQTSQSTGIATFTLRVAEELNETTQQSVKDRISRALTDYTQDIKWELFVEFTR